MKIAILTSKGGRAATVARALEAGARAVGHVPTIITGGGLDVSAYDAVAGYGWVNKATFEAFKAAGKPYILVDLGYWNRKPKNNPRGGYHKVSVNSRDPMYFRMDRPHDRLGGAPAVTEWRERGGGIIIAGSSAKAHRSLNRAPYQWEKDMIDRLSRETDRQLIYRPKPSDDEKYRLPRAEYAPDGPIENILHRAKYLVTLRSNVIIEAVAAGVPVYCEDGIGKAISVPLDQIETNKPDFDQVQFLADVSYTQWRPDEMASGQMWRQLQKDGLI